MFNLVAALISYPAGAWSDKLGRKSILLISFGIFFLSYLGFAFVSNILWMGGLFVFYGLFQGMFRAVGKSYATDFVPAAFRASSIGWYSAVVGLSGLVASIVAGQLWDKSSHAAVFLYGAIFSLIAIVSLLVLVPGSGSNHKKTN